jgi:hypothetical protein
VQNQNNNKMPFNRTPTRRGNYFLLIFTLVFIFVLFNWDSKKVAPNDGTTMARKPSSIKKMPDSVYRANRPYFKHMNGGTRYRCVCNCSESAFDRIFFLSPDDTLINGEKWYGAQFWQFDPLDTEYGDNYFDFIRLRGDTVFYFRKGTLRYLRKDAPSRFPDEEYPISVLFIFPKKGRTAVWESENTLFSAESDFVQSVRVAKGDVDGSPTFLVSSQNLDSVLASPMAAIYSMVVSPKLGILSYKYQDMNYQVYDCSMVVK